jgi:hypothetical protein
MCPSPDMLFPGPDFPYRSGVGVGVPGEISAGGSKLVVLNFRADGFRRCLPFGLGEVLA